MSLALSGHIDLPEHRGKGGFDHADVDRSRSRLYVAHTANDGVDVVDLAAGRYLHSIEGLSEAAGVLVSESDSRFFTSNRGENTIGIGSLDRGDRVTKVEVGVRPNGLAYDAGSGTLLAANVGDPAAGHPPSVTLVDVKASRALSTTAMPGRTRWTMWGADQQRFFVNVSDPPLIAVVNPRDPAAFQRWPVPARGPHGLALDAARHRLYCACDEGKLVSLDSRTGEVIAALDISGTPDVVFLDAALSTLYVAVGDPGVIDVIDVAGWTRIDAVTTERGAHTIALDDSTHRVYAFLPATHRAAVFEPGPVPSGISRQDP